MSELDIGSILSSLSPGDIDNIKSMAAGFLGDGAKANEGTPPPAAAPAAAKSDAGLSDILSGLNLSGSGFPDLSMLSNLAPLLTAFNKHDERSDFIVALKPLLSEGRQKKADEAAKIIKLISVLPLLRERGIM